MPESGATTASSSGRQGRSQTQDRRRGRSRSPSAYLRKKGKSLKGMLSGDKIVKGMKKSISSASLTKLSSKPMAKTLPAASTTAGTAKKEKEEVKEEVKEVKPAEGDTVFKVDLDEVKPDSKKSLDAATEAETPAAKEETTTTSEEKTSEEPAAAPAAAAPETNPQDAEETIQIILLLMELQTHRFELLQLEFDPNKALVHDILAQIPKAATEDGLKNQSYEGICSVNGDEMSDDMQLKNFVKAENEVKLAIPTGISGIECARLAAPILSDKKVHAMLDQLGTAHIALDSLLPVKEVPTETEQSAEPELTSEEPIQAAPGSEESDLKTQTVEKIKEAVNTGVEAVSSGVEAVSSSVRALNIEQLTNQPKPVGIGAALLVVSLLVIILAVTLSGGSKPLAPGSTMKVGQSRNKCGIKKFMGCDEMTAELTADGILSVMNNEKTVLYRVMAENSEEMADNGSLQVGDDGLVTIGGSNVVLEVSPSEGAGDVEISPWPFSSEVNIVSEIKQQQQKGGIKKKIFRRNK